MKTLMTPKSFSELSPAVSFAQGAPSRAIPESFRQPPVETAPAESSEENVRTMLHRRATAPFVSAIPYHRCGINE